MENNPTEDPGIEPLTFCIVGDEVLTAPNSWSLLNYNFSVMNLLESYAAYYLLLHLYVSHNLPIPVRRLWMGAISSFLRKSNVINLQVQVFSHSMLTQSRANR